LPEVGSSKRESTLVVVCGILPSDQVRLFVENGEMKESAFSEDQFLKRLRRLVLVPIGWLILAIVVPNFVMDVLNLRVAWLSGATEVIGILLYAGLLTYLLVQVRKEGTLVVIVLIGLGLVAIPESIEIAQTFHLLDYPPGEDMNRLIRTFENALNGLGFAAIALAIFYALIDMLAARHRLLAEHAELSQEIANRKRIEEALRKSEVKYRELVENANSIILRMDRAGRVTFINEFAQRFFGFAEHEILGRSVVGTIVPPEDSEGRDLAAMIQGIVENPLDYANNENENMRSNGERVWIAWTNKPIVDAAGYVQETLCVGNDITSRVRTEKLLAEQRTQMIESARLASLGTMAGSIAHEINNPLAVIAGCAEQLESRAAAPQTDDIPSRLLRMIRGNTERIQRTIQGLRSLSRDASGDPFVKTPVANIILNTVELCRERFRLNSIDIENETPGPDVAIECRPSQIGQVILNLLNNSFDAVKELPEKWIKLTVIDREEWVEIAVEDSGWGIPKETADRLFVPFFTTKSTQRGLGLGLSISHAIIDAHHGEMILDPSCSHTRFLVRLPKHQPASAAGALDTAQEEG